ncbi:MAG: hypothetical protein WCO61_09305 [Alphaproteobacteria bacterium]
MSSPGDFFRSLFQTRIFKLLIQRIDKILEADSGLESNAKVLEPTLEQKKNFEEYKDASRTLEHFGYRADSKIQATYLCKVFLLDQRRDFLVSIEHDLMNPIIKSRLQIKKLSIDDIDKAEKIEL